MTPISSRPFDVLIRDRRLQYRTFAVLLALIASVSLIFSWYYFSVVHDSFLGWNALALSVVLAMALVLMKYDADLICSEHVCLSVAYLHLVFIGLYYWPHVTTVAWVVCLVLGSGLFTGFWGLIIWSSLAAAYFPLLMLLDFSFPQFPHSSMDAAMLSGITTSTYYAVVCICFSVLLVYRLFLNKKFDQAEASHQLMEKLTHVLVRDLERPLNSIQDEIQHVKTLSSPADERILSKLEKSLDVFKRLLEKVAELRLLRSPSSSFHASRFDLSSAVDRSVELMKEKANAKGISLVVYSDSGYWVKADETMVSYQIIPNLISNAIKFSSRGQSVRLSVCMEGRRVVLSVIDHGIGIPPQILKHLFSYSEPTTRVGTEGEKGTGLGMPLVKGRLQLMGGDIHVESSERGTGETPGTIVRVFLPAG